VPRLLGLAGLLILAACTPAAPVLGPGPTPTNGPPGLTVFVASSLKDAFAAASLEFKAANPQLSEVRCNFAGSQQLVAQLQQGAPGDVFASADKANMDKAVAAGVIDGPPRELARNRLVVALPHDNPGHIQTLADLARPGVKLSLADPSVPVGAYTVQALDKLAADPAYGAGYKTQVLANVVSREDNVRQVLTRVQLGEVDAGVVYGTDAQAATAASGPATQPVLVLAIPAQYNVTGVYYVAVVKGTPHPAAAHAWINYLLSDAGQAILTQYGFIRSGTP
jgi:molybdate transport system substrate-binding protein